MPLGEIKQKALSRAEVRRLEWLLLLRYPQEGLHIWHLSGPDFISWLYLINPRTALLFSTAVEGKKILEYQKTKSWYHEVMDWLWRNTYGNY